MRRLIAVEWLRLHSRRMLLIVALISVVGLALMLVSYARDSRPPSAADQAAAAQMAKDEANQPWVQESYQRCLDSKETGATEEFPSDFDCSQVLPQPEWFLDTTTADFAADGLGVSTQGAVFAALAALIISVSFVGADWTAGTIGTQLLYESRRRRLLAAKTVVGALVAAVLAAVLIGLALVVTWVVASMWGSTAGVHWGGVAWHSLRLVALVAAVGAVGIAATAAVRHSVAVLGVLIGYMLVGEALIRNVWSGSEPWLISSQMTAWTNGGADIMRYPDCSSESFESSCEPIVHHISLATSSVYLGVLVALLLAIGFVTFQRRDVT